MLRWLILVFIGFLAGVPAYGEPAALLPAYFGGTLCRPAIQAAERAHNLPHGLLAAIGRVESGRRDPTTGHTNPWPWTVNAEGQGSIYDTKAQAVAAVQAMQARGIRSIDVGCMQVNLMHHPDAFPNLETAFDPSANADYAARFLTDLYQQAQSWPVAAGHYHSATPDLAAAYQKQVMAIWPEEQGTEPALAAVSASPLQRAWAATIPPPAYRHADTFHIIPLTATPGHPVPPGRGLAAYRLRPVAVLSRIPPPAGG